MTRTVGINPAYLDKLSERQRKFILTGVGRKFYDEYLCRKGNHTYIIGTTGSGKTNAGFWFVDFLKYTENIIWFSTGKSDEILPLLFMGCRVRVIIPKGADFDIRGLEEAPTQPDIIEVSTPGEAWHAALRASYDHNRNQVYKNITIFEFRNTLDYSVRSDWLAELFTELAEWSREGTMPKIFPCSIFLDESQWVLAGTRITTDQKRTKTSEIITENALEIRSKGGRLVFFAQDHKNVTPASRENMLNAVLMRGANVSTEENRAWARACGDYRNDVRSTSTFRRGEGRFVFDDGRFYPNEPWKFALFPEHPEDREKLYNMGVEYGKKFAGLTERQEEEKELMPELGAVRSNGHTKRKRRNTRNKPL